MIISQSTSAYTVKNLYDFDNQIILHQYPKMILDHLIDEGLDYADVNVLDLGLGHGYSAQVFQNYFTNYTILDGDKEVIDIFNKNNHGHDISIVHTFFEDYMSKDNYDVIVAGFILEHVVDPLYILKKYKDMLSSNGKMFIAVPNAEALNRRIGFEAGLLDDIEQLSSTDIELGHRRYYTVGTISSLCIKAGLTIKFIDGIYLKPFTTKQILSLNLSERVIKALCKVGREYPELCLGILVGCEV